MQKGVDRKTFVNLPSFPGVPPRSRRNTQATRSAPLAPLRRQWPRICSATPEFPPLVMNQSLTLCCALCIFGQTAGIGQTSHPVVAESPAQSEIGNKPAWTLFSHPVLGFEVPVPPNVNALGKPESASTVRFVSDDGRFAMTVHGAVTSGYSPWVLESNWKQVLKLPGRYLSSHRKAGSWFEVSGFDRNGTEFYQKCIVEGNKVAMLTLTYPHSRAHEFNSRVSAIQQRFRIVPPPVPARAPGSESPNPSELVNVTPPPKRHKRQPAEVSATFTDAENLVLEEKTTTTNSPAPPTEPPPPYGVRVEGKPGFIYTPYGSKQMVDVVDLSRGTKVRCPFTDRIFRVP
jgi:hypothetical protein